MGQEGAAADHQGHPTAGHASAAAMQCCSTRQEPRARAHRPSNRACMLNSGGDAQRLQLCASNSACTHSCAPSQRHSAVARYLPARPAALGVEGGDAQQGAGVADDVHRGATKLERRLAYDPGEPRGFQELVHLLVLGQRPVAREVCGAGQQGHGRRKARRGGGDAAGVNPRQSSGWRCRGRSGSS